jgi:hypothetical protein
VGNLLKNPKKRRMVIASAAAISAVILVLLLHKKSTPATEETTSTPTTTPLALPAGEAGGGSGSTGGSAGGGGEISQLGSTIGNALQTQQAETDQAIKGLSEQISTLSQGHEQNSQAAAQTTPPETNNTGPSGTPLASSNRSTNGAKKYTNTEKGNPRKGKTYTIQHVRGGIEHVYANGERIFVRTSRSPSQRPEHHDGGSGGGGGGGPQVASQSPQPASNPHFPHTNTEHGNPRYGQHYRDQKGKGGVWHIYEDGARVFLRN